jgi:beta-glucosidase
MNSDLDCVRSSLVSYLTKTANCLEAYTKFEYSKLFIKPPAGTRKRDVSIPTNVQTQDYLYTKTGHKIIATIKNIGSVDAAEVVQLYLSFPLIEGIYFPRWQLRGFKKVALKADENKTITFDLRRKDISYWNTTAQMWIQVTGGITVKVAPSSRQKGLEDSMRV